MTPYDIDLDRNPANFQPLTPLSFLERAAAVFPDHTAIIHGPLRRSYAEFYARCRRLASALARRGIGAATRSRSCSPTRPPMLEGHYGVPMTGAVLNTINTRLDAAVIAFQLDHADAKVLIVDREFSKLVKEALALAKVKPLVIDYDDPEFAGAGERLARSTTRTSSPRAIPTSPGDAATTNGTRSRSTTPRARPAIPRAWSITTAAPTCSRSATCSPAAWASTASISGRCRCSTATAGAFRGRSRWSPAPMSACARCARAPMYDAIADHKVTHLCGAPIVMSTLLNARARGEAAAAARRRVLHRRGAAAGGGAGGDEGGRLQRHPSSMG